MLELGGIGGDMQGQMKARGGQRIPGLGSTIIGH
jgi:hypothetical protein